MYMNMYYTQTVSHNVGEGMHDHYRIYYIYMEGMHDHYHMYYCLVAFCHKFLIESVLFKVDLEPLMS